MTAIFTSDSFTADMLSNPTRLSKAMIDAMEASDTSGAIVINDPNNGFVMQLFANMSIFSKFSEKVDGINAFFYSQRARNAEQLYAHLSEFDYVQLMASPATLPFRFAMSRDWIVANAVPYDSNYNKIVIPATSYIAMGGITYSMYYPIEMLVNRNTGAVTAYYDTSINNDLNTLASNMLLDVQQFTMNGLNYFQIVFTMYQFTRTSSFYTAPPEQGFLKTLGYDDQFYAVKVFTQNYAGQWNELQVSLSQRYYDYQTPTAVLTLLTDQSQIKLQIPQIYFNNGQISQSIRVDLYTTKGKVNYALSPADVNNITANFDTGSSIYANPLVQMPTYSLNPTQIEIAGGSDAKSYASIRDAIVHQELYDRVAVTPPELTAAFHKAGFNPTRVTDDLTERMYYAANILTDANGIIVPTFAGAILLANESLIGNPGTILNFTDGTYTLLPTTVFSIAAGGTSCVPLSNGQVLALGQMTQADLIAELNKGTYVRQPFHITLSTPGKSPRAQIYNLLTPNMTSLVFNRENAHCAPQMSVTACAVTHLAAGTGGYQIVLGITRSSNIDPASLSNFAVLVTCFTKTGLLVYLPATYVTTNDVGIDLWQLQLTTSYHLSIDDYLMVMMTNPDNVLEAVEISLNQTFTVLTGFNNSFDPTVPVDPVQASIPPAYTNPLVIMAQQTMVLSLGQNLSNQIYCGVTTSWGNDVYETATTTVYYQTNVPTFQTTETGVINTRYNTTTHELETVLLFAAGSTPPTTTDIILTTATDTLPSIDGATSSTYQLSNTTGILPGMNARGTNIPVNSVVESKTDTSVTLSHPLTILVKASTQITFTNQQTLLRTTQAQSAAGIQIMVESTAALYPGLTVIGFDIPSGTIISSIDSPTQFSLSEPTSAPLTMSALLTIVNLTAPGVVKVKQGDVITDPTGKPIIVKDAQNQYLIPAILFDGRLFASQDKNDQTTTANISSALTNYATQIATIDAGLLENAQVFYKPARTMGMANFGIGGDKTINLSLELSFSVTVYVDESVYNTQTLLSSMTTTINAIINTAIQQATISVSAITAAITQSLGNNVTAVEMGPISGIDGLRLVSLEETGAVPSIENLLSLGADGVVSRSPNIQITYLPKPDTSAITLLTQL